MSLSFNEYLNNLPDAPWLVNDTDSIPNSVTDDQQQVAFSDRDASPSIELANREPVSNYLLVSNLKPTTTKTAIEVLFSKYGVIRKITINKDTSGVPNSTAVVEFAIQPFNSYFGGNKLVLDGNVIETDFLVLEDKSPRSTTTQRTSTTRLAYCKMQHLLIGTLTRPTIYQEMWRSSRLGRFSVDTLHKTCEIGFQHLGVTYKLDIPWSSLSKEITMETTPQASAIWTMSLRYPPRLWEESFDLNLERDVWKRSTVLYTVPHHPSQEGDGNANPISLCDPDDQVHLDAWTDYRLEFGVKDVASDEFEQIVRHLMNHGLLQHTLIYQRSTSITVVSGKKKRIYYDHNDRTKALDFQILYMLECAITNKCLNQYNLDAAFYDRLTQLDASIACKILLSILSENTMKYNALAAFQSAWQRMKSISRVTEPTVPDGFCMIASVLITPTSLILQPPAMEQTSRALRHYISYADRFLRVTFVEDDLSSVTRLHPRDILNRDKHKQGAVFQRIRGVLANGIDIGNRHYTFLAFDSSQLLYHSCWFFAPTSTLLAADVLATMVDFESVTTLDQYIAAMDICFRPSQYIPMVDSTDVDTEGHQKQLEHQQQKSIKKKGGRKQRPSQKEMKQQTLATKPKEKTIEFIDDWYNLSNNSRHVSGKISPNFAREIIQPLDLESAPSAIQYSLGGCLGVLALSNAIGNKSIKIQVRPSHYVFNESPTNLEVMRCSSFAPAFLDRTLISLLSSLGVSGHIFLTMMQHSMATMNSAFSDSTTATEYLKTFASSDHPGTVTMRQMISAGFLSRRDPFLLNMLWVFRTKRLIDMKKNAGLHVPKGARLMVIMDDTGTLESDEIFCQLSDLHTGQLSKRKRITGSCFVVNQPCVHSGDIRLFEAVDKPHLRHWCDVIVVSSKQVNDAPRQHLDGKMDGRRFTIIWDANLQPYSKLASTLKNRDPPDQDPHQVPSITPPVAIKSFMKYLRNDHKDTLLRHYMLTCDKRGFHSQDSAWIKIALQYADAADYTNVPCPISIDPALESSAYPDYMEIPGVASYPSNDIQGQLYRMISPSLYESYTDQMMLKNCDRILYDARLKLAGMEPYIIEARDLKNRYYHDIKSLMDQYGINTEAELISGEVVDHSRQRLQDHHGKAVLREGMIKAMDALQRHYRQLFSQEFETKTDSNRGIVFGSTVTHRDSPDVLVQKESKAAAWYYVTYHPTERTRQNDTIMFSFPWLLIDLLCPVARRQLHSTDTSPLDQAAIEKYRTQTGDMSWISMDEVDSEYNDSDEDDDCYSDDDYEEDEGDDDDGDQNNIDGDDDGDDDPTNIDLRNGEPIISVDARNWTQHQQQVLQQDHTTHTENGDGASVPIINIKLSDIAGLSL